MDSPSIMDEFCVHAGEQINFEMDMNNITSIQNLNILNKRLLYTCCSKCVNCIITMTPSVDSTEKVSLVNVGVQVLAHVCVGSVLMHQYKFENIQGLDKDSVLCDCHICVKGECPLLMSRKEYLKGVGSSKKNPIYICEYTL